ncbi:hypothetical protein MMC22_006944 [Lobaria immixta]|nr:hypothetical protein [Lobaria immixta]
MSSRAEVEHLRQLLKEAERGRHEAERGRQEEQQRTQRTSLEEYLQACHNYLHTPLSVEHDARLTTKGMTNPKNKYYPTTLSPWEKFSAENQSLFDEVCGFIPSAGESYPRPFSPILYLEELKERICRRKLASEPDLQSYERMAVEDMVTDIIGWLCKINSARDRFGLGRGVTFENHTNSLSDTAEEVQEHLHIRTPPMRSSSFSSDLNSDPHSKPTQTRADQFCVYSNLDGNKNLLFVVEYKPPHKLTTGNLKAGCREMKIEKILGQATTPTESEAKLQYNADQLVSAVATQTFHYMIENGLKYSYITTGEAFVFLHIKKKDPTTLYYHLTVPTEDAVDDAEGFLYSQTAISQVVTLCLLAFQSKQRDQQWRQDAKKQLKQWKIDYEAILLQIPETERKLTPSVAYKGGRKPIIKRSPIITRNSGRCKPGDLDKSSDDDRDDPDTPSGPGRKILGDQKGKGKMRGRNRIARGKPSSDGNRQRQYCTQTCLLGIAQKSSLDQKCPNVSLHRTHGRQHAIDLQEFLILVRDQLAENLDRDCEPLGLQGARGALFKITLTSYGYVFVGKGTVQAFVPDLMHEGRVYQQLKDLQGTAVPVCLGNIDLVDCYYLDVGVRILHMLLMSWGGQMVSGTVDQEEVQQTLREVRAAGIDQGDVRTVNLLWNKEKKRAMLIDFERAVYLRRDVLGANATQTHKTLRANALQEISPNKESKRGESSTSWQRVEGEKIKRPRTGSGKISEIPKPASHDFAVNLKKRGKQLSRRKEIEKGRDVVKE